MKKEIKSILAGYGIVILILFWIVAIVIGIVNFIKYL
jgi:hypothetical protein